jgi:hypothetical protein
LGSKERNGEARGRERPCAGTDDDFADDETHTARREKWRGKGREGREEEGEEREGEEVCDGPISKDRILSAIKELWGFPQIAGSKKKNRLAKIVKRQCQVLKRHLSRNIVVCGK